MASAKAALKAVKVSIDAGDFAKASTDAAELLKQDGKNYNALMFLGFAEEKLKHFAEAEKALKKAADLRPQDVQPYKGLVRLYEQQGADKVDAYHDVVANLTEIYAQQEDREQCQGTINQFEAFVKKHGSPVQYRRMLEYMLPTSPVYRVLEGRVPHPSHTYQRILESSQAEEKRWTEVQIAERRTRLGATLSGVTAEVRSEAIDKFHVEECYQNLIDWTQDDEVRHALDQELLQRMLDNLLAMPPDRKPEQRDRVLEKANGMVVIRQPFQLAWNVALEWVDSDELADWEPTILHQYIELFPEAGFSKVLRGLLYGSTSPFPLTTSSTPDEPVEKLSETDQLIIMIEGLEECNESMLAYRIMAQTYLALNEHERAAEMARKSSAVYRKAEHDYAMPLQNSLDAVNLILGRSLVVFQSPRHHPEARAMFEDTLARKPQSTEALIGIGLIYEEDEDYPEATKFLARALQKDPDNLRIRLEHAWCRAQDKDLQGGLDELLELLARIEEEEHPDPKMKAEALYRIGFCIWHLQTSVKARKDKSGAYKYLIDALKADSSYAPAYTLLGHYFLDLAKNKVRARVAFQKAFELSTSELSAAEQLAQMFALDQEWDLVELVAQRVVDSGKARPAPGSKKKAHSWPYAALGMVQMDRAHYSLSIISFQHALRISSNDYHCWIGLGESYHNSGRFVAASRAFLKAETMGHDLPAEETWFAQYMLANVWRELGAYDEAIQAYENVLAVKEQETGVLLALLQTLVEYGWARIHQGHFGHATELAAKAITTASLISRHTIETFNLWKGVGDACSVLHAANSHESANTAKDIHALLQIGSSGTEYEHFQDVDHVAPTELDSDNETADALSTYFTRAAVLAHKRAINVASGDAHALAVAYYNLGWAEYHTYIAEVRSTGGVSKRPRHLLKAAVRAFKHAIEQEAGNSEFWNALGIAALTLSPKVSQHSFIRSLHLNDHSAQAWTNLGVLYLHNNEYELANQAFTKAQSADPEYAAAWVGQGILAASYGREKDAANLFTHAFDIADSSSLPAKRYYVSSAFDSLLHDSNANLQLSALLQPIFGARQLYTQLPEDDVTGYLLSLLSERVGEHDTAETCLTNICQGAEARYEASESNEALAKFAQAKADLARQLLAQGKNLEAREAAQFVLDISEDDMSGYAELRNKWRLSAQLTAGLASGFDSDMSNAIASLQTAAETSKAITRTGEVDPSVTLLLAQTLWTSGAAKEREAARTQLFECIENHPDHVDATILLAVISLLDGDDEGLELAEEDLKSLRSQSKVSLTDKLKIVKVLNAVLRHKVASAAGEEAVKADALASIMLSPDQPQGWLELSNGLPDDAQTTIPGEMAVKTAMRQIPPGGKLDVETLAQTYVTGGRHEDRVQASMLAPWLKG